MKGKRDLINSMVTMFVCLSLFLTALCLPKPFAGVYGQSNNDPGEDAGRTRIVRVGFPMQEGLTEKDSSGKYSGYTYEYLEEIAQYTGWEYEFVELPGEINDVLTQMLEQLKNGELDLLGGIVYNSDLAQTYDFPGYSYGSAYLTLSVLKENTQINEANYHARSELRVAVKQVTGSDSEALMEFCKMDGINARLVSCGTAEGQYQALTEGRADAMLNVDISPVEGMRTIAKFHPKPFYFAATKGNSGLIGELNDAMIKINESDPYFAINLYDKYFESQEEELHFTPEEQAYLDQAGTLRVGIDEGKAPVQYYDETGELAGISKDLFTYLTEKTGLRFEFIRVSSQAKLAELLNNGEADLASGISYDYDLARAYHVALTKPYAVSQVMMAVNKTVDPNQLAGKKLALTRGFVYDGPYIGELHWFETVSDCVAAVAVGKADYCYGNAYSIQYYANELGNDNLLLIPQSNRQHNICIGVTKPADPRLINIINKTVRSLSEEELQAMIYRNTMTSVGKVTLATFIDANPRQALLFVSGFAGILILLMACILYLKSRSGKRIARANDRYEQLCALSNEYVFEYDYPRDELTLSDPCAKRFGKERVQKNYFRTLKQMLEEGSAGAREREELEFYERIKETNGGIREQPIETADRAVCWYRITVKMVRDKSGRPEYCIGKLVDIQEEHTERESLLERARKDSLTGVYNAAASRRLIADDLRAGTESGALIIVDVDWFKNVNDQLGHFTGDRVLINLAGQIRASFRDEDIIGRLGGDEFIIYMKNVSDHGIVARRCRRLLERMGEIEMPKEYPKLTLSIGVALSKPGLSFNELYQMADLALYEVKRGGRGSFKIVGGK